MRRMKREAQTQLTTTQAAQIKGCTMQAIQVAFDRGDFNGYRVGRFRIILNDDKFRKWRPLGPEERGALSWKNRKPKGKRK